MINSDFDITIFLPESPRRIIRKTIVIAHTGFWHNHWLQ